MQVEVRSRNMHGWGPYSEQFTVYMFQRGKQRRRIANLQHLLVSLSIICENKFITGFQS